jgi:hypothetical protein
MTAQRLKSPSSGTDPNARESIARAAFEGKFARVLTDQEWAQMRCSLTEFASILRVWDQRKKASQRGNVEVPCQQEQ